MVPDDELIWHVMTFRQKAEWYLFEAGFIWLVVFLVLLGAWLAYVVPN